MVDRFPPPEPPEPPAADDGVATTVEAGFEVGVWEDELDGAEDPDEVVIARLVEENEATAC